jgi:predicted porin
MKKNLIALAVSAAMVAPVAVMADVTVYGIGQVELSQTESQASGSESQTTVNDANGMGRVGVKASEDLGNGMTAMAGFEFKADSSDNNTDGGSCTASSASTTDEAGETITTTTTCSAKNGGASLTGRDSYVGLKGGFGTVMAGRLKSTYKYTGGVKYDAFVATNLESRGNAGMSGKVGRQNALGHSSFVSNLLGYSNKFGPVDVDVQYLPGTDDSGFLVSGMYKADNFEVFVSLVDYSGGDGDGDDYTANKVGGKFSTGPHSIMLQIEDTEAAGTTGVGYTFIGYQMKMGMNTLVFQYGMQDHDTDSLDGTYMALGAYHNFSKTTSLFGGYRNTDIDDDTSGSTAITVGMRQKF